MATKWNSPVTRELEVKTHYAKQDRNLLVTIDEDTVVIRPKGTQHRVTLNVSDLYESADKGQLCFGKECEKTDEEVPDADEDCEGSCQSCDSE